jgi:hypothetical protein
LSVEKRHIDTVISNTIMKKGTRNSFHLWPMQDYDLTVTRLQIPHAREGFGLTPNTLPQSTAKVAMASRFVGLVGSLPPEEQQMWLPNQLAHEPQTWVAPHLLQLKSEYAVLLNKHNCKEQKMYIVQDQPLPPSETLLLPPLEILHKVYTRNQPVPGPSASAIRAR